MLRFVMPDRGRGEDKMFEDCMTTKNKILFGFLWSLGMLYLLVALDNISMLLVSIVLCCFSGCIGFISVSKNSKSKVSDILQFEIIHQIVILIIFAFVKADVLYELFQISKFELLVVATPLACSMSMLNARHAANVISSCEK